MNPVSLDFFVPGEPQSKARPRTFRNKQTGKIITITPKETKTYEGAVSAYARQAIGKTPAWGRPTMEDRFALTIEIRMTIARGKDIDNVVKAIMDGLQPIAVPNDSQIARLSVVRRLKVTQPGVRVVLSRCEELFGD